MSSVGLRVITVLDDDANDGDVNWFLETNAHSAVNWDTLATVLCTVFVSVVVEWLFSCESIQSVFALQISHFSANDNWCGLLFEWKIKIIFN